MTILGILLTILKTIGIILLILLLLVLVIILLILFVPVRYKVHADKVGWNLNAGGNVSWLLHMISVDVGYGIRESGYGGGFTKDIRIFGISIFKVRNWLSDRKKKKAKAAGPSEAEPVSVETETAPVNESQDTSAYSPEHSAEGAGEAEESPQTDFDSGAAETPNSETDTEEAETPHAESDSGTEEAPRAEIESETGNTADDAKPRGRSLLGWISGIVQKVNELLLSLPGRIYEILVTIFMKVLELFAMLCGIPGRIVAGCGLIIDKMLTVFGKITLITDFFFDDRTQDAIHLLLCKTGNLLGHVRPRTLSGHLDFGFDDPSITGRVLGILSVFLPQVGKTFDINPDFENSHLECDITSSGRIYLFYLIYIAASTYFNKNIKYVFRYVKHLRKELSQA